jgi:hypothetical protein
VAQQDDDIQLVVAACASARSASCFIFSNCTLTFGNGGSGGDTNALYFASGLDDETHGLFGSLRFVE